MMTKHASYRNCRLTFIKEQIGIGKPVHKFFVDRGHKDGPEWHVVTTTGIVAIYNAWTEKFITALIARPNQILRYYQAEGRHCPQYLLDLAMEHQNRGWNSI